MYLTQSDFLSTTSLPWSLALHLLFCFSQEKPLRWKEIHTHTYTHTHTHTHTPHHTQTSFLFIKLIFFLPFSEHNQANKSIWYLSLTSVCYIFPSCWGGLLPIFSSCSMLKLYCRFPITSERSICLSVWLGVWFLKLLSSTVALI